MDYILKNNEMVQRSISGELQFNPDKDAEAVKAYFIDYVNKNMRFYHTTQEKIEYLVENDFYDSALLERYTMEEVVSVFDYVYSFKFRFTSYMSAFKFYNDYAMRSNDKQTILERYEDRVSIVALDAAMGDIDAAMRYAGALIRQEYQPATPTFLNSGRSRRGELVSCFLLEIGDSLNDINMAEGTGKQLSKVGGGVSFNLSKVRAKGESIKGIENATKGVVGVMKMLDHAFRYADQMGQRQGAGAAYLDVFHADIQDFLETKKISADEDFRVKTLSIGVVVSDKFYELARKDKPMFVFYPKTVFDEYGVHLDEMDMNVMYPKLVQNSRVRKRKISARALLQQIAVLRFESGYPFVMFKDNVNKAHALDNLGIVKFSNLCTEILQYSKVSEFTDYGLPDNIGMGISCNLGSLNIKNVMDNKSIKESVYTGTDMLTFVTQTSDVKNAPEISKANRATRSIGLGVMNLHGYLAQSGISYESETAREFASVFFAAMNYYSIDRSNQLANELGSTFEGFEGSRYHTGTYFDMYLENEYAPQSEKVRALFEGMELPTKSEWESLKHRVMDSGLYHGYRLAIAPTGSISYVQSSTAGVMPVMERIEERTYGNSKTYYPMPGLGPKTWFLYKEAYDMDMFRVVDMIATIQPHIDQGISFTLFIKDTHTTRDLTRIDLYAHYRGIKTLYYARTKDDSQAECLSCTV